MTEPTDEELNLAIWEWRGWKVEIFGKRKGFPGGVALGFKTDSEDEQGQVLPSHIDGIEALGHMHEAERQLLEGPLIWANYEERGEIKRAYGDALETEATLGGTSAECATARQRAVALLRVVKPEIFQ